MGLEDDNESLFQMGFHLCPGKNSLVGNAVWGNGF